MRLIRQQSLLRSVLSSPLRALKAEILSAMDDPLDTKRPGFSAEEGEEEAPAAAAAVAAPAPAPEAPEMEVRGIFFSYFSS